MSRLLVATRNRGKQQEFRTLLAPSGLMLLFPEEIGLDPDPEEETLEVHDTFEANALAKAHWFARRSGLRVLADDSGVEVDALDGNPGVHSRRFAGLDGPDHDVAEANRQKLLHQLIQVPSPRRTARYRGVLVLSEYLAHGAAFRDVIAHGVTEGRILPEPRGNAGFGYDSIFWSDELGGGFGEVSQAAKDSVSHRARAAALLLRALQDEIPPTGG